MQGPGSTSLEMLFGDGRLGTITADDVSGCEADPWGWWRSQMPIAPKWAYFDHAAVGPLSGPATAAIAGFAADAACQGDTVWPQWARSVETLRGRAAELINADAAEICMIPNTTAGINLVAEGYPWRRGDSVVVPEGEFPSNLYPWLNQREKGVEVRQVPRSGGAVQVDDLMSRTDGSTRIIAVSWVGYASGFRIDIETLVERAHEKGILVFLDAIQGLGMYDLDCRRTPVDFLAADGHKWLLSPEGAGLAFIRREHLDRLRCPTVGWNSVKNAHDFAHPRLQLRDEAARYEGGSANMVGLGALSASLALFLRVRKCHGSTAIQQRVLRLVADLEERLGRLGVNTRLPEAPQNRSGIVTFEVPGIAASAVRELGLSQHVVTSCRDGGVRASLHAYNNEDDLTRLVEVIKSSQSL